MDEHALERKRTKKVLIGFGLVVLIYLGMLLPVFFTLVDCRGNPIPFNKAAWDKDSHFYESTKYLRQGIAEYLVDNQVLIGLTNIEVQKKLGESSGDWSDAKGNYYAMAYWLGPSACSGIDDEYLAIKLNAQGLVSDVVFISH